MKTCQCKHIPMTDVLLAYEEFPYKSGAVDVLLAEKYPEAHPNVIWKKMEKAEEKGYVEYGFSLRYGWLTPKGEEYLNNASIK